MEIQENEAKREDGSKRQSSRSGAALPEMQAKILLESQNLTDPTFRTVGKYEPFLLLDFFLSGLYSDASRMLSV